MTQVTGTLVLYRCGEEFQTYEKVTNFAIDGDHMSFTSGDLFIELIKDANTMILHEVKIDHGNEDSED